MSEEALNEIRRKWLPIYMLVLLSLIFVILHLIINYRHTGNAMYINWAVPTALLAAYIAYAISKLLRIKIPIYHYYKTIKCIKCGYEITRETEGGEYLFSKVGKCPKCSGDMIILKLYRKKSYRRIL